MRMGDLVSIIVPVYNVEAYLDECIASIVAQSYINIEIILIDDGSTDGSLNICKKWTLRDNRIRLIAKDNEGLGPTRNLGVKEAKGKWLAFIDSDDWIDKRFIEKMYSAVATAEAEIVTCSYYRVDCNTGVKAKDGYTSTIGIPYTRDQHLVYMSASVCPQLCAKRLFDKYKIEQPNCKAQDFAVKLLLCALAKKHIAIDDVLWYYRVNRPDSITSSFKTNRLEKAYAAEYLINGFRRHDLFDKYSDILQKHILIGLAKGLMVAWKMDDEAKYKGIKEGYVNILKRNFSNYKDKSILHIGGYNLVIIIRKLPYLRDINLSFQFSSLISIMHPCGVANSILHTNRFRQKMIERDVKSVFWEIFEAEKPSYLVIDFLEERHDILYGENGAITKSDAFNQIKYDTESYKLIQSGSSEWFNLWIQSCKDFMKKIENMIGINRVILVKNFLVEEYGDIYNKTKYKDIEWIGKANKVIEKCYQWIEEHYPEIYVVEASKEENYFTDKEYEYGIYPWHLNTFVNEKIAKKIEVYIR